MQEQLQQLARQKQGSVGVTGKGKLAVLGQECVEPLQALRKNGEEVGSSQGICFAKLEDTPIILVVYVFMVCDNTLQSAL